MEGGGENQQSSQTILCAKGCGFFGSPAMMNMCSKCFREHEKPQQAEIPASPMSPSHSKPSTPIAPVVPAEQPKIEIKDDTSKSEDEQQIKVGGGDEVAAASSVDTPKKKVQKNRGRCFSCRKKVGLTGFECKCGYVYCGEHRYSDKHECDFDYKTSAREQLTKANPVVVASKLEKI